MAPPRQQVQARARRLRVLGLGQDTPAKGHDGIRRHDQCGAIQSTGHKIRLFHGQALGMGAGQFIAPGGFIKIGRAYPVGHDPDLPQELKPARRSRGQDKLRTRIRPGRGGVFGHDRQGRLT
ncbi:hypothetical protein AA16663_0454 [Komagataeibacter rhaeticus DSM 16663]|nr:hypothetical protein AA16663_0454 [Komagataeibacter rhaeticus DSM 16663]